MKKSTSIKINKPRAKSAGSPLDAEQLELMFSRGMSINNEHNNLSIHGAPRTTFEEELREAQQDNPGGIRMSDGRPSFNPPYTKCLIAAIDSLNDHEVK